MAASVPFQPGLFDAPGWSFDAAFTGVVRERLDERSWVDYLPNWVTGDAELLRRLETSREWGQRSRWMYERQVLEPRLTAPWNRKSGPLDPPILEGLRAALSRRYGAEFDSIGFNLYRDGQDSVAWHRDHIRSEIAEPVVALVSLGHPRRFLMRPHGGGKSRAWQLGRGDLFVTGGRTQRDWDHAVPKVAKAEGPRISLAFRYGLAVNAYGGPDRASPPSGRRSG